MATRSIQYPKSKRPTRRGVPRLWIAAAALVAGLAIGVTLLVVLSGDDGGSTTVGALPNTPDYHSLLVAPDDPKTILLGTHEGLYRSIDGGVSWKKEGLSGRDAMNLARAQEGVLWTAGHNVFARSTDGGATWENVQPQGLPHLDIHGFAVDPDDPTTLYAALAGQGLYRSTDGGESFNLLTSDVGAGVMALAVTPDGRILAGDMSEGLMASDDGGGTWTNVLRAGLMGIALNPEAPDRIVATGPGILLSNDGGRNWEQVLAIEQGAGPVAWSASDPQLAYVVGFDRVLYKTTDGGETWQAATGGGES